jgi:hypothetical protein
MWWFSRKEDPPPGLPTNEYALVKLKDGWYFVRSWPGEPGSSRGERHREGPFPEKEDARYWAWKDAWDRGLKKRT